MTKKSLIFLNLAHFSLEKINKLVGLFPGREEIPEIRVSELRKMPFLTDKDIDNFSAVKRDGLLEKELKLMEGNGIRVLDIFSEDYPSLLKEIPDPPVLLYLWGNSKVLNMPAMAIVGTRLPSSYGLRMTEKFAFTLAYMNLVVVSGLARGIDTQAHRFALQGGKTVAVLGSGMLNLYPGDNQSLARRIRNSGALISEFPLLYPPLKENFPRRNRIISGLSRGVIVIEASTRSGALITARLAVEQNREVFALPGNVDSAMSKGPNKLIKEGATPVDSIEDIIKEFDFVGFGDNIPVELSGEENRVFEQISDRGTYIESLVLKSGLSRDRVNKVILSLQIKGMIRERRPLCFYRDR